MRAQRGGRRQGCKERSPAAGEACVRGSLPASSLSLPPLFHSSCLAGGQRQWQQGSRPHPCHTATTAITPGAAVAGRAPVDYRAGLPRRLHTTPHRPPSPRLASHHRLPCCTHAQGARCSTAGQMPRPRPWLLVVPSHGARRRCDASQPGPRRSCCSADSLRFDCSLP